jgi:hypothetical protein
MQIRKTIGNPSTAATETLPEDVIVLVDGAGVALGVTRMKYSIEGALRREAQARPTLVFHRPERGRTLVCHWQQTADGRPSCHWGIKAQRPPKVRTVRAGGASIAFRWMEIPLVDGNGQISGVLCQSVPPSDVHGALVSRGRSESRAIEDVARLAIHEINSVLAVTDAIPDGRTITVAAHSIDPLAAASWEFVEIVAADKREGMPVQVLLQAIKLYFASNGTGGGTGLGLVQVQRFAEGGGSSISIECEHGADTRVWLFLPRVCDPAAEIEIAYMSLPNRDGGVFHIVNAAATEPTS